MDSVVQAWLGHCSWKQQTVVLCALRGCDGVKKEDPSKTLTRYIRRLVLHNAGEVDDKFMQDVDFSKIVGKIADDLDHYPVHWVMHTIHAFEIIGFKHPNPETRKKMIASYEALVKALHLNPETEEELDNRLADKNRTITRPQDVTPTVKVVKEVSYIRSGYNG